MLPDSYTIGGKEFVKVSMEADGTRYVDTSNGNRTMRVASSVNKQGVRRTLFKIQTTEVLETSPGVSVPAICSVQFVKSETAINTAATLTSDTAALEALVANDDLITRLKRGEK